MVQIYNQLKLKAMVPYGLYGMEQMSVVFPIVVLVPKQVVEQVHQVEFVVVLGTVALVRTFLVFCEGACSDNMGNKESSVGILSFRDGINLSKFPIVEEVKEVFFYTI